MIKLPIRWEWEDGKIETWVVQQRKGAQVQEGQILARCVVDNKRIDLKAPGSGLLAGLATKKPGDLITTGTELNTVIQCSHATHFGGMPASLSSLSLLKVFVQPVTLTSDT